MTMMSDLEQKAVELLVCTSEDIGIGSYEYHGCCGHDSRWALFVEDQEIMLDVTDEEAIPMRLTGEVERDGLEAPFVLALTGVRRVGKRLIASYRPREE